jgi:hypothetical protein
MPTRKVKGGYQYGRTGKIYKTKAEADRQGRAIEASKARRAKGGAKKKPNPFAKKKR